VVHATAKLQKRFPQAFPKNPTPKACGLLRASFRPGREIAALRAYLRLRERHLDYAAAHIQHMQKALTFMNLHLHHVVSDVTGATGLRIDRQQKERPRRHVMASFASSLDEFDSLYRELAK